MKSLLTALPLLASLAWTAALIADNEPFGEIAALLMGIGLMAMGTVSVVGMIVSGGRWARNLALANVMAGLLVAVVRPIDAYWFVGLISSAAAAAGMYTPQLTSRIRRLPAAAGPPPIAVIMSLVLVAAPFAIGLALDEPTAWAALTVGLSAPLAAFMFARVIPGGLLGVRLLWPLLAIGLAPLLGMPAGLVSASLGVLVAILAWQRGVKVSFHPPTETGTTHRIPPELTPDAILDAANIDEKGRGR